MFRLSTLEFRREPFLRGEEDSRVVEAVDQVVVLVAAAQVVAVDLVAEAVRAVFRRLTPEKTRWRTCCGLV